MFKYYIVRKGVEGPNRCIYPLLAVMRAKSMIQINKRSIRMRIIINHAIFFKVIHQQIRPLLILLMQGGGSRIDENMMM